jgi:hypothetical protein
MKYEVWTTRALLIWVPVCLMLGLLPPIASLVLTASAYEIPWHVHIVNSLMPLVALYIVWRRHDMHARIRDSIDAYIGNGTRLVIDVPYMSKEEMLALEMGLVQAQLQCNAALKSPKVFTAHDRAFLIVRSEVLLHRAGKKVRVGGLTYAGGPMVIEYTTDLALLQDRARHEGCHYILNVLGRPDWTGDDHHKTYPELFS